MPPTLLVSNSLEGGVDDVEPTPANSGGSSGSPFDAVNTVDSLGNPVVTYDRASRLTGQGSLEVAVPSGSNGWVGWDTSLGSRSDYYLRMSCFFTGIPSSRSTIFRSVGSGVQNVRISISNDGEIAVFNSANAVLGETVAIIPIGSPFRIEVHIVTSTTVGVITVRLYDSPFGGSLMEEMTFVNQDTGTASDTYRFGVVTSIGGSATFPPFYFDDITAAINDWIGPVVDVQKARPSSLISSGGWTAVGAPSIPEALDEVTPSAVDYAQSSQSPSSPDVMEVKLSGLLDPNLSSGHIIRYMLAKNLTGGERIDATVQLVEGTTVRETWTHEDVDPETEYQQILSSGVADSIVDYTDLRLRIAAVKV